MNQYFKYRNIEFWDPEKWKKKSVPIQTLALYIGHSDPLKESEYALPEGVRKDLNPDRDGHSGYLSREEREFWAQRGYSIALHHMWISRWISLVPEGLDRGTGKTSPVIVSLHQEHVDDNAWAVKTMRKYRGAAEAIAQEKMIFLISVTDGPDYGMAYSSILMEAYSLFPINPAKIYLDVSAVYATGRKLKDVPGGIASDERGGCFEDPDAETISFGEVKVLPVCDTWKSIENPLFSQCVGSDGRGAGNASYDSRHFVHTPAAARVIDSIAVGYHCKTVKDSEAVSFLAELGLKCEEHEFQHERWVSVVPLCMWDTPEKKLPVLLVFQEVYDCNDHLTLDAISYWFEFCKIAAQGECMLVFYANEYYEGNDRMIQILHEAERLYPVDDTRVYTAGFSHNSGNATRFAYDHADEIAAVAGGLPATALHGLSPEEEKKAIERMRQIDMPCVQFIGVTEHMWAPGKPTFENSELFNRMKKKSLLAANCEPKDDADFRAAYESSEKATRIIGMLGDKSEVLYLEGVEHYITDVKNRDGKWHLRIGMIENMPHTPFPTKQMLEWSFVRRFARDQKTHEIIERY